MAAAMPNNRLRMRFIDVSLSLFLAASTGPLDFNHNDRRDRNGPSALRDILAGPAYPSNLGPFYCPLIILDQRASRIRDQDHHAHRTSPPRPPCRLSAAGLAR